MFTRDQLPAIRALTSILVASPLIVMMVTGAARAASQPAGNTPAQTGTVATMPGKWQTHQYEFHFMGFTSIYSCGGLADKLRLLLQQLRPRNGAQVTPLCAQRYGVPDKFARAKMTFSSLVPLNEAAQGTTAEPTVPGVWLHVKWAPDRPYDLRGGDCELIEEFRDSILPMFATRRVNSQLSCIPHEDTGTFSLSFDVFVPAAAASASNRAHGGL